MKYNKKQLPRGFVTEQKQAEHARVLSDSVRKKYNHLRRRYAKEGIDCFRLYDWDSPDIRVVVDWYAGHIVVGEYERIQTGAGYLDAMAAAVSSALGVCTGNVHIKRRHTVTSDGDRYSRLSYDNKRFVVNERDIKLYVDLDDFLDTGLYSDHRNTRRMIRAEVRGKDFLNLFAYTGVVTLAAIKGGAKTTATVDRNKTYIDWAKENLALNDMSPEGNEFIALDTFDFLKHTAQSGRKYSYIFVDPPSFFKDEEKGVSFDVNKDHVHLLTEVIKCAACDADIIFSTNHQRFEPRFGGLRVRSINELTPATVPEDYRNKKIHRCWRLKPLRDQ